MTKDSDRDRLGSQQTTAPTSQTRHGEETEVLIDNDFRDGLFISSHITNSRLLSHILSELKLKHVH